MRWRSFPNLIALAIMLPVLSLRHIGTGSAYRFRMTVEVDTPSGPRTGTSVYEVRAFYRLGINPSGKNHVRDVRGEALMVDLPNGATLFALLKTGNVRADLPGMSMLALDPAFQSDIVESARRIARRKNVLDSAEIAPAEYPIMAIFGDTADPSSIRRVLPADFSTAFGPGHAVKSVAIHLTRDRVTKDIGTRLPWLNNFQKIRRKLRFRAEGIPPRRFQTTLFNGDSMIATMLRYRTTR